MVGARGCSSRLTPIQPGELFAKLGDALREIKANADPS